MLEIGEDGMDIWWVVGEIGGPYLKEGEGVPLLVITGEDSKLWAAQCLMLEPKKIQARFAAEITSSKQNSGFVVWVDSDAANPLLSTELDEVAGHFVTRTRAGWILVLQWSNEGKKYHRTWAIDGESEECRVFVPDGKDPDDFVLPGWVTEE